MTWAPDPWTEPVIGSPPRLTPAPDPLPPQWQRAIANSIAERLRRPWTPCTTKRAISNTGSPITGRDYAPTPAFQPAAPTTELIATDPYARGVVEPLPALSIPMLAWELKQLDLAEAMNRYGLMQHAGLVETWLRHRLPSGPPPSPFRLDTNRHRKRILRRNADYTPEPVASTFLVAVTAATIWLPDPDDAADIMAEGEPISLTRVLEVTGG